MSFDFNPEHAAIAQKIYAEGKSEIDQELAPEVWGYWPRTKKGVKYMQAYNYKTGEIKTTNQEDQNAEDGYNSYVRYDTFSICHFLFGPDYHYYNDTLNRFTTTPRGNIFSYYAKYFPEYECLQISLIFFHADRKIEERHKWENYNTFFMFKNDPVAYSCSGGRAFSEASDGVYYNKALALYIRKMGGERNASFNGEIVKFMGHHYSNGYCYTWNPWSFSEAVKKFKSRKESSRKLTIESLELKEIDCKKLGEEYPEMTYLEPLNEYSSNVYTAVVRNIVKFEIINDNWVVFRVFTRGFGGNELNIPLERCRMYIDAKGKVTITKKTGDNWKITSITFDNLANRFIDVDFDKMYDFPRLKYIRSIIETESAENKNHVNESLQLICGLLRHPIIEKLYKSGYPHFAMYLYGSGETSKYIYDYFGVKEKSSGKSLYADLNTSKFVLKFLEESSKNSQNRKPSHFLIAYAEEVAEHKLKFCNEETTHTILEGLATLLSYSSNDYQGFLGNTPHTSWHRTDRWKNLRTLSQKEKTRMFQLFKLAKENPQFIRLLKDTQNTIGTISQQNRPEFDINDIQDYNQLVRIHDLVIDIKNREWAERRALHDMKEAERLKELAKKCEKLYETRTEKYEYSDDEFCVVVPKEPLELVHEGAALHHCLGGYKEEFSMGNTDILFLRQKKDIDTSFYSIEIKNNRVVQIHGLNNKWLGLEIKAARFMYKYLKLKKISYDRSVLTCKSYGYSSTGEHVSWNEIIEGNA